MIDPRIPPIGEVLEIAERIRAAVDEAVGAIASRIIPAVEDGHVAIAVALFDPNNGAIEIPTVIALQYREYPVVARRVVEEFLAAGYGAHAEGVDNHTRVVVSWPTPVEAMPSVGEAAA